jgi:hypothetical protein
VSIQFVESDEGTADDEVVLSLAEPDNGDMLIAYLTGPAEPAEEGWERVPSDGWCFYRVFTLSPIKRMRRYIADKRGKPRPRVYVKFRLGEPGAAVLQSYRGVDPIDPIRE